MEHIKNGNPLPQLVEGMKHPLRLDIQYFSETPPAGDPPAGDPPAGGTPPATPPADPGTTPPADPPADPKTFSQDDVSAIAAREAKKAQEKILKELGIEDFENAKDGLGKFREWQDSQKTEAQKQADALAKTQADYEALQKDNANLKAETAALKKNVNPDSISDVITLANNLVSEDVTIDDAIGKVLEKYPHFGKVEETPPSDDERKKPNFTQGQHQNTQQTEADKWLNAFKI